MARTDWTTKDTVRPADMNEIGQEINDLGSSVTVWLGVTEGIDTEYTVTSSKVSSLFEGLRVSFRAHVASGANPTLQIDSLGAVPLKKPNGRAAKLDADGVYTAVYSAASFTLQGEGGEYGTATAEDVLAPKTIGTDEGLVTGTIPTKGEEFKAGTWSNPDGDPYVDTSLHLDGGYYPPNTKVTAQIYAPTLTPENIKAGVEILGVQGDPNVVNTGDATANAGDLLSGKEGYVKGQKVTGNIPILTGTRAPLGVAQSYGDLLVYPEKGYQKGGPGDGQIIVRSSALESVEPNLRPKNIRLGTKVFGVEGEFGGGFSGVYNANWSDYTSSITNSGNIVGPPSGTAILSFASTIGNGNPASFITTASSGLAGHLRLNDARGHYCTIISSSGRGVVNYLQNFVLLCTERELVVNGVTVPGAVPPDMDLGDTNRIYIEFATTGTPDGLRVDVSLKGLLSYFCRR